MPAIPLINVDLPAPLSPTSAMTSPGIARKSTFVSACTAPNRFEMPFNSRMGALPFSDIKEFPITRGLRKGHGDPCPLVDFAAELLRGAVLFEVADADFFPGT